jgi:hypothetical protein
VLKLVDPAIKTRKTTTRSEKAETYGKHVDAGNSGTRHPKMTILGTLPPCSLAEKDEFQFLVRALPEVGRLLQRPSNSSK